MFPWGSVTAGDPLTAAVESVRTNRISPADQAPDRLQVILVDPVFALDALDSTTAPVAAWTTGARKAKAEIKSKTMMRTLFTPLGRSWEALGIDSIQLVMPIGGYKDYWRVE